VALVSKSNYVIKNKAEDWRSLQGAGFLPFRREYQMQVVVRAMQPIGVLDIPVHHLA
jgi:hypothetical protein